MIASLVAAALVLEPASSAYADEKGGALRSPEGVACTDSGTVVAADTENGRLVLYVFKEGKLTGGAEVRAAELGRPVLVQIDSKGDVLALDQKGRRIARIGVGGAFQGFVPMRNVPTGAGFFPISFKLDARDNFYVLDGASARVVVLDAAGEFARQFQLPKGAVVTDVAVDSRGVLYVVDAPRAQLYVLQNGAFAPLGKPLKEYVSFPGFLAVTAQGPLVIVDKTGNGLVVVGRDGGFLARRLSIGWSEGLVYYPGQLCINAKGDAFVADRGNHRIQAFTAPK
jgi:hypothetical protein